MTDERVTMLRHGKVELALHELRGATTAGGRPLLILNGLGAASPLTAPTWAEMWPGSVHALDFTGHGGSTIPRGGGYSAELLLADTDVALAALTDNDPERSITVVGRGLGAYIALQIAGARAAQVHGAILVDGPGLAGGPTGPTSLSFFSLPPREVPPDPYALVEMARDLRPPDYATLFVRLALAGSDLDEPIAVTSVFRPEWLEAVANEPGVMQASLAEALATYAG